MGEQRFNWGKGCAIGCAVVVAIPILLVLIVSLRTWIPLQSSGKSLARVEEQFGSYHEFVPAADGAIAPQRVLAFLEVRRSLQGLCEEITTMNGELGAMAAFEEGGNPSAREVTSATRGFAGVAVGIAPLVGRFFKQRNRALLESGVGLGEYSYIFALAYREQFLDESIHRPLFSEFGPVSPEAGDALRAILGHQLESLAQESDADPRRLALAAEIQAMQQDPQRLPWRDGLPPEIEASFAPYREQLDERFCLSSAGIDMDPDSRRALYIALE